MKRAALLLAIALGLAACSDQPEAADTETTEEALLVKVTQPKSVADSRTMTATGTVRARSETTLSFTAPGRVAAIGVDEGDFVRRGALLARLDPAQVGAATAAAKAELERAQAEYERQKYLFDRGWVTAPRIETAEASLKAARAQVQSTQFDASQSRITAPAGGIILTRHVEPNQIVTPGQPIVTVAESSRGFVLRVPVTDRDLADLTVGAPASITITALGDTPLEGQIVEIGALGNQATGTFEVEIGLPAVRGVRSGLVGDAEIVLADGGADDALIELPALAIFDARAGEGFVYVAKGGKAVLRMVQIARVDGDSALIAEGLSASDRVIVSDIERLKAGRAIRIAR